MRRCSRSESGLSGAFSLQMLHRSWVPFTQWVGGFHSRSARGAVVSDLRGSGRPPACSARPDSRASSAASVSSLTKNFLMILSVRLRSLSDPALASSLNSSWSRTRVPSRFITPM